MNESSDNVQYAIAVKNDFSALTSLTWLLKTKGFTSRIIRRKENEKTEDLGNS